MKKLFDFKALAATLVLGGAVTAAYAASPTVTPAESIITDFSSVVLLWDQQVTAGANWDDGVTMTFDGATPDGEPSWMLCDINGWPDYFGDDDPANNVGIAIYAPGWITTDPDRTFYNVTVNVEAGTVNVNGVPNEALSYTYKVVEFNNELIREPSGTVSSLSSFKFKWEAYDQVALNPAKPDAAMHYGYEGKTVENITIQDGWVTVTVGETITDQGLISFDVPQGMFLVTTPDGAVPNPYNSINYNIQVYTTDPGNYDDVDGAFSSFTIYAEDAISLIGQISAISMRDFDEYDYNPTSDAGVICRASAYEEVTGENGQKGIKVTFPESFDEPGTVLVVIPGNTFSFNGNPYNQEINLIYYIKVPTPDPTATPESGSIISQLDLVTLNWGTSALWESWIFEDNGSQITMTINGGEPIDITDKVSIVNDEEPTDYGWPTYTNGRVVIDFSDEPYTEPGVYMITIPESYVEVEVYQYATNAPIELTYTVSDGEVGYMDPATFETLEGTSQYLSSMGTVSVTWDLQPITLNDGIELQMVYNDGEEVYDLTPIVIDMRAVEEPGSPASERRAAAAEDANGLALIIQDSMENPFFSKVGTYTIQLPAGLVVNNDGLFNPAQTLTFNVLDHTWITPTITPETDPYGWPTADVTNLEEVTITWDNLPLEYLGGEIRILNPNYDMFILTPSINDGIVTLNVADYVTVDGTYEVIIPAGSFLITEEGGLTLNSPLDLSYRVTVEQNGIEAIEANDVYNVVSIDGMTILKAAGKDALNTLAPGLYIINGKKAVIRK